MLVLGPQRQVFDFDVRLAPELAVDSLGQGWNLDSVPLSGFVCVKD